MSFFTMMMALAARRKLPYTPVAYLESTGTQWINTGVAPDFANGDEIEIRYRSASYTGAQPCIFGSRETGVRNGLYALAAGLTVADGDGYSSIPVNLPIGESTIKVNDSSVVVNGTAYTMPRRVSCGLPIYLFTLNNYNTGIYGTYNGLDIMEWTYRQNGSVAQHLVPALDDNGVPCMWDTVSNTAKYNAGTGFFDYA